MSFFDLGLSDFVGDAIGAAGGILSGITGSSAKELEYKRQKEFAQNGVRWRVADAKAAGIHPLAALGNMPSYSPQAAIGTDFGLGALGQNISRAQESKQTKEERAELDSLQKDLLRSQINNVNADTSFKREQTAAAALLSLNKQTQLPPPMPSVRRQKPMAAISSDLPVSGAGAINLASNAHVSPDKVYEAYEVPFHGSQLPLPTDEASNMMEGMFGEVQWNMRRMEDAVSRDDDTYYDFTTGTYRHNKYIHGFQKFLLRHATPEGIINDFIKFTNANRNAPLTAWEKQVLLQSGMLP